MVSLTFSQDSINIRVNVKIFLQGPFNGAEMETSLRDKNLIPLLQPYNIPPWEYNGNEKVQNIPKDVVDWIFVELSKEQNESAVTNQKACFLKADGEIFNINNEKGIVFRIKEGDKYYIIVHHRNHLSIVSSKPMEAKSSSLIYDFSASTNSVFGNSSLIDLGNGIFGMPTGDSDANGIINSLDFKVIGEHIFNKGYINCDLDMNGVVNVLDYGQTNINITKKSYLPSKSKF